MKAILIGAAASLTVVFAHSITAANAYASANEGQVIDQSNAESFTASTLVQAWNIVAEQEPELFKPVNRFPTKSAGLKRFESMCVTLKGLHDSGEKIAVAVIGSAPKTKQAKPNTERRPTPVVAGKSIPKERWRREKYKEPSKVSYAPRSGSLQEKMAKLLTRTRSGELTGITAEKFCETVNGYEESKGKVPWEPSSMWSSLNYLFVSQKGYGMRFTGTHIMLIEAADHRVS